MHFISFLCIVFSSLRINHVMYVISLNNTVLTHRPTQLCLKFTPPLFSAISSQSIGILFFSKLKTKQKIWDRSKGDGFKNKCSELCLFFILKKMLLKFTALDRGSWCYLLFQNKGCVGCRTSSRYAMTQTVNLYYLPRTYSCAHKNSQLFRFGIDFFKGKLWTQTQQEPSHTWKISNMIVISGCQQTVNTGIGIIKHDHCTKML